MDARCQVHRERGRTERKRERERQRESQRYSPSDKGRRRKRSRGEDTYLAVYPNLNDSSEEQYKAKETEIRQEADGGGQGTGVATTGDISGGRQSRGGNVPACGMSLKPTGTSQRWKRGPTTTKATHIFKTRPSPHPS